MCIKMAVWYGPVYFVLYLFYKIKILRLTRLVFLQRFDFSIFNDMIRLKDNQNNDSHYKRRNFDA